MTNCSNENNTCKNNALDTLMARGNAVKHKNLTVLKQDYSKQIIGKPFREEQLLLDFRLILLQNY